MTKKEYLRKVMGTRPRAKEWRELAEKAIRGGCIDYAGVKDYIGVYPLAIAIVRTLTGWWETGSHNEKIIRWTRREVKNIECFI